jgi:cysteine desulfurase
MDAIPDVAVNGSLTHRLPHNLNLSFNGVDSESVLTELRDIALSSGSACSSAAPEASHVLQAMGLDEGRVKSAIRFGLGRNTTAEEIDYVVDRVTETVNRLRQQSPRYRMGQQATTATPMEH